MDTPNNTPKSTATDTATAADDTAKIATPKITEASPAIEPAPAAAGAPAAPAIEPIAPAKIEAAEIEGPEITPPKIEAPKIELAPAAAAPLVPVANPPGIRRHALLAASIVLAAACGAMAGALSTSGFAARVPASDDKPAVDETRAMKDTIAQLRTDIAALKVSIEAANRNSSAQISKISERFDRADRLQSETAARPAHELTGSIAAAAPTAVPLPPPAATPPTVPGWIVRDVSRGIALIQGRIGLIEVEQGDVVPGLGRIEAVRRQDGRWVVVTAKGIIASR